jgi:hypothetical protein
LAFACRSGVIFLFAVHVPQALEGQRQSTLAAISAAAAERLAQRRPLVRAAAARQPEVKLFNPRFEEDFAAGKEYDPDRCAAAYKFPVMDCVGRCRIPGFCA